ncbi:winged helix-turn-helix domain-containing protein [Deinococcus soli (ex Cha et al. 2016)]|uniref:DNA-binding transcriptional ArsR family regulator n=2 Tax=Deinococcus soli (ex Cha et al. 2016) TaxID=1309411 RepID=A0AAE3XG86_9DEIO|nr:winged helix-turn-helix domain-containing protein [Deinococcus soli (ex Cha et al. 2016)]MDR6219924.1 DNA-binding transcriptional ArsR family regulator [Deinococcus soli (ex Cha et al. 2016)]MDR6329818.1 DNA-binding transcriptional ArsR family regulator [Deinococcus soli (ex Cha et al. 2016)]MDR6752831.1 DNA-binding transcriptional ArsR family regulator [Deinococcus soli (ex Cha et al. 2016)]
MPELTPAQLESLRVTDESAARALRQDTHLLGLFLSPASPSDVAARAGMPANLAHHHARRLAGLGLLFEQRREAGRVYYQLRARTFRVPSDLLPPQDPDGNGRGDLRDLTGRFLAAYERCWAHMRDGEEDVCSFGNEEHPAEPPEVITEPLCAPFPAHLDRLTLRLTPERYARLARDLSDLLTRASAEGHSETGAPCTLALLTFSDPSADPRGLSRHLNSFLGLNPAP